MNFLLHLVKKVVSGMKSPPQSQPSAQSSVSGVRSDLSGNLDWIKQQLGHSTDLVIRQFVLGEGRQRRSAIVYVEGLADTTTVLEPLSLLLHERAREGIEWSETSAEQWMDRLVVPSGSVKREAVLQKLLLAILSGDIAVLWDGEQDALIVGARKWKERSIQEPEAEPSVRGPREGFTETLRTNTALLRRKIRDPRLWMETMQIGRVTHTDISIMYVKGLASDEVLAEVRRRLNAVDVDSILESGYIQEYIQDQTLTPFPLVYSSERPDVIASEVLEGRVAILVDGTPFVLVVPALFTQFLQAAEDYYQRWDFATLIRIIRYISLFISLMAPALYIAIVTFHQEIIPPSLLMSLISAREGVPFPAFVEAMIMEITFEILREAGLRMPKNIGQAVSIVGTLVIGQAAVDAGLVSPAMVIVVALTAISNFVIPAYAMAISFRILRFGMMMLAGSLGIFGIVLGLMVMVFHLCSLRSFGVPYLSSFAPFHWSDQKDTILRLPRWLMITRPHALKNRNFFRTNGRKPGP
ncbi:spore germination protein [Cohnella candidum]|nr:spore germination protein [Cohnella candidum]